MRNGIRLIVLLTAAFPLLNAHTAHAKEATSPFTAKIVGGIEAVRGEFPFMASLQSNSGSHFCGGSLVRPNWVLTAAHCVRSSSTSRLKIVLGLHRQNSMEGTETRTVSKIIVHPNYNSNTSDYDFALVQLAANSNFQPVRMNDTELSIAEREEEAQESITAGWGTTSESGGISPLLMKVGVPLVSAKRCDEAYPGEITPRMICAGFEAGGKDSCQGDSGGPLLVKEEDGIASLVGVVSWGEGCARPKKYGVYSKVNSVFAWIESQLGTASTDTLAAELH